MTPVLQRAPTREVRTFVADSRRWAPFEARSDDIVIATYPKCGTTWMQRIVDLLVFQDAAPRPLMETSVWLDARFFNTLETDLANLAAQTHRRFVKSHLPFDALPVWEDVKYIHVARGGLDAFMSWHNHSLGFTPEAKMKAAMAAMQDPDLPMDGPPPPTPEDPQLYFQTWIAEAEDEPKTGPGAQLSFFDFEMTYWAERTRPNLLMVHYNDLKADLPGEMARIGAFLGIETPSARLAGLAEAARFAAMKAEGEALLPQISQHFDHGHHRFLNKGTNGRWKDVLTEADLARYRTVAHRKLTGPCLAWIEGGRRGAGDPRTASD